MGWDTVGAHGVIASHGRSVPMQALAITRQGSPVSPNVALIEMPDPQPGAGQLRVRTEASALNHLDLWVGMGLPGIDTVYPFISGSDGAGVVDAVGPGIDASWIGRRVLLNAAVVQPPAALPGLAPAGEDIRMIGEHDAGCMAEKFVAPATNVIDIGDADPVRAAAFGLTHLTAWRMLWTRARVRPGMTVLIPGIGGGVAVALLGIARHLGCTTIVTSRHAHKLERARSLGADHAILDDGGDWSREVRKITARRGVDIVADSVGKAVHGACLRSLARGGTFVTCGCTSGSDATTDLTRIFWNQVTVMGSTMGDMDEFRSVVRLFVTGALSPVVDQVLPSARGREAFARLEAGEQFGKLVVDWR
jgi:NADPH:quinone reductase-like Zn-dependent oxidoreductase